MVVLQWAMDTLEMVGTSLISTVTTCVCKSLLGNLHLGIISDNKIEGIDSYVFEWTSK